jgi:hypothetical protein
MVTGRQVRLRPLVGLAAVSISVTCKVLAVVPIDAIVGMSFELPAPKSLSCRVGSNISISTEPTALLKCGWGGPVPTPIFERDEEAIRELSNDEIQMEKGLIKKKA